MFSFTSVVRSQARRVSQHRLRPLASSTIHPMRPMSSSPAHTVQASDPDRVASAAEDSCGHSATSTVSSAPPSQATPNYYATRAETYTLPSLLRLASTYEKLQPAPKRQEALLDGLASELRKSYTAAVARQLVAYGRNPHMHPSQRSTRYASHDAVAPLARDPERQQALLLGLLVGFVRHLSPNFFAQTAAKRNDGRGSFSDADDDDVFQALNKCLRSIPWPSAQRIHDALNSRVIDTGESGSAFPPAVLRPDTRWVVLHGGLLFNAGLTDWSLAVRLFCETYSKYVQPHVAEPPSHMKVALLTSLRGSWHQTLAIGLDVMEDCRKGYRRGKTSHLAALTILESLKWAGRWTEALSFVQYARPFYQTSTYVTYSYRKLLLRAILSLLAPQAALAQWMQALSVVHPRGNNFLSRINLPPSIAITACVSAVLSVAGKWQLALHALHNNDCRQWHSPPTNYYASLTKAFKVGGCWADGLRTVARADPDKLSATSYTNVMAACIPHGRWEEAISVFHLAEPRLRSSANKRSTDAVAVDSDGGDSTELTTLYNGVLNAVKLISPHSRHQGPALYAAMIRDGTQRDATTTAYTMSCIRGTHPHDVALGIQLMQQVTRNNDPVDQRFYQSALRSQKSSWPSLVEVLRLTEQIIPNDALGSHYAQVLHYAKSCPPVGGAETLGNGSGAEVPWVRGLAVLQRAADRWVAVDEDMAAKAVALMPGEKWRTAVGIYAEMLGGKSVTSELARRAAMKRQPGSDEPGRQAVHGMWEPRTPPPESSMKGFQPFVPPGTVSACEALVSLLIGQRLDRTAFAIAEETCRRAREDAGHNSRLTRNAFTAACFLSMSNDTAASENRPAGAAPYSMHTPRILVKDEVATGSACPSTVVKMFAEAAFLARRYKDVLWGVRYLLSLNNPPDAYMLGLAVRAAAADGNWRSAATLFTRYARCAGKVSPEVVESVVAALFAGGQHSLVVYYLGAYRSCVGRATDEAHVGALLAHDRWQDALGLLRDCSTAELSKTSVGQTLPGSAGSRVIQYLAEKVGAQGGVEGDASSPLLDVCWRLVTEGHGTTEDRMVLLELASTSGD